MRRFLKQKSTPNRKLNLMFIISLRFLEYFMYGLSCYME